MNAPRLFNLDTVMIDVLLKVVALPVRGSDTLASQHLVTTGGGFNVMSAATRHGLGAVYAGRLGVGPFSDIAREALRGDDIDTPIGADPLRDIGFCLVLIDDQGERTFVTSKGAELGVAAADLETVRPTSSDYVYLSGYNLIYPEIMTTVTTWIEGLEKDVVVAFDPGARVMDIDGGALRTILSRGDWLLCNAAESLALSGEGSLERAMDALLARTGRHGVVVHDGAAGCLVATREQRPLRVAGFETEVVDTNGAGDTHNGVFLAELALGTEPLEAARRANAAAAMAISELGPATCPSRDEVSAWYAQFPS
jgi:sugar/nucleoside kinase (ribokinase family)